ncbi:CG18467 [Drosophila busckii]|uniref:CG18467 n=2 Tax=Drosophila busckii TaxID=30019 RepID=A0A0M4E8L0_DROBS|nr:CG18467 [Drosophila busckii]
MCSFQDMQTDLNYLILNFLIKEGSRNVALHCEVEARMKTEDAGRIRQAVRYGQLQYAIEMAKKLHAHFGDNYIYFHMQQLQLIEFINDKKEIKDRPEKLGELYPEVYDLNSHYEPKMVFLVKLIIWAQAKLDNEGCVYFPLFDEDFEMEIRRALQGNEKNK